MGRLRENQDENMKVLYDHQIFSFQRYGGISRYFCELIRNLRNHIDVECDVSLFISCNQYLSDYKLVNFFYFFPDISFRGRGRIFSYINKTYTLQKLKKQDFDIFHPTYYDPYFLKYIGNKPFVLTVYDMIHEKFREMFSPADKTSQQKRLLLEKATKIIAISQNTKKDLIEIYGANETKIEVVYLGNSVSCDQNLNINCNMPKKYLLYVGSRGGYKNFLRFIRGIAEILKQDREMFVVCAGGGEFKSSEKQLFSDLGIERQVLQYNLNDESLAYFYKNAISFIFPSLYEGFGMPILEAFACGCPVICSNTSSLPEIAGSGAYYFDPYSEESIKNAVLRVLEDSSLRECLVMEGYKRVKQFSWQKTAEQTKKIYESLL